MIEVDGVSVTYRSGIVAKRTTPALVDVSLRVGAGVMLAIVGESGCGKSTLLRAIAGMVRPDHGSVRIGTRRLGLHERWDRLDHARSIQLIAQHPELAFDPRQTIAASLSEVLSLHRNKDPVERTRALFTTVGLQAELHDRYPHELSGGQLQRATVARALATDPRVLLLDEPTSMLDASVQARVVELLQTVRRESRVTMVLVTHDIDLARVVADEIAVLFEGRLVEHGTATTVFSAPTHPHTRSLVRSTEALRSRGLNVRGDENGA